MGRITKDYKSRLEEFLDTGRSLFFSKGYEQTSVNDIIKEMNVAKGTFYHYFRSKEDLLDKIIRNFSQAILEKVRTILKDKKMDAVSKLNEAFISMRNEKIENIGLMILIMKALYNDKNLLLRHKMFKYHIKVLTPEFGGIIKQGITEGCFNVSDPLEVAELILAMGMNLNEIVVRLILDLKDNPGNALLIEKKIELYEESLGRILGAGTGKVKFADKITIRMFIDAYQEKL